MDSAFASQPPPLPPLQNDPVIYKVYPMRWFIIIIVSLLSISNQTLWVTYVSVSQSVARFYCNQTEEGDGCQVSMWTNQIFQLIGVLLGVAGMYITDKHGIKASILSGTILNAAGLWCVRSPPSQPRHSSSVISASAAPFFMVLCTKVAEFWFAEHQRALANVLSFIANLVGIAAGSVIPALVLSAESITVDSWDMFELNAPISLFADSVLVASLFIRSGSPPTPPSASAGHSNAPDFLPSIAIMFKTRQFLVVLLLFSFGLALQWSVFVGLDQLTTQLGYSESLTAYMLVIGCLVGCFSSIAAGAYVDRTKKFKEVIIVCFIGLAITAFAMNWFLRHSPSSPLVESAVLLLLSSLLGCFAIPIAPVCLELGVEATFPVLEATSSGILSMGGQCLLFVVIYTMDLSRSARSLFYTLDGSSGMPRLSDNHWLALDLWNVYAVLALVIAVRWLRPKYKRVEFEKNAAGVAASVAAGAAA